MDGRTGDELMRRSVLGGSAIGVLLSLRSGVMDRRLAQAMPFGGLQDAFDLVLDKAEHGEPFCIYRENHAEAFALYRRSAKLGEPRAFFRAGLSYELGEGTAKDVRQAAEYYQQALAAPVYASRDGAANRLGAFYFNGEGVPQDFAKAFQLLKFAYDENNSNNWGAYYLGACYAYGRGTQQDYAMARKFLEMVDWNNKSAFYLLGYLYARGLGGPEDIAKGVEYLRKAGDHAQAREELRHYKKTLFGKWVRR